MLNEELILNKWIDCFHNQTALKNTQILINNHKPFLIIQEIAEKDFVDINTIIKIIRKEYNEIEDNIIYNYINELLKNGFLISNLRLSLLYERNIDNLISVILLYKDELNIELQELEKIKNDISNYNQSKIQKGLQDYFKITSKLKKLSESENYVSVDLYNEEKINLDSNIKKDINELVIFLNMFANNKYVLEGYYMKYIEKYNYDSVNVIDVFDEISGIGFPQKDKYLFNKINNYIYKINNNHLDLSDIKIDYNNENSKLAENSFEISLNIFKFKDTYKYIVTPLIGSDMSYKALGRFYKARCKIKSINNQFDNVELCYFPKQSRIANVLNCYSDSEYYLEYGCETIVEGKKRLSINDVYICPINGILKFINGLNGHIINFTINNMTNLNFAPDIIKSIYTIDQCSKKNLLSIFSQIFETFKGSKICPKITYKNFILKTFEIRLLKENFTIDNILIFKKEINSLLTNYSMKNIVYCGTEDNYLILNLSNDDELEILRKELNQKKKINIRTCDFNEDELLLSEIKNNKKYIFETIFQINCSGENSISPKYKKHIFKVNRDWISLKLYMKEDYMDNFIINHLKEFASGDIKGNIFYLRYKDPESHLRIRIKKENFMFSKIDKMIATLEKQKIIDKCIIDEYMPEINRYGGIELIKKIEEIFMITSELSKKIINYAYPDKELKQDLYYFWTFDLLKQIENYCDVDELLKEYKEYYKRNKTTDLLRKKIFDIYKGLYNKHYLYIYQENIVLVNKLNSLMQIIVEKENYKDILLSLFHMNFNRTIGINRSIENETMANIESIYYSLKCFLSKGKGVMKK